MSRGTGSEGGRGLPPQKILVRLRAWGRDFAALEAAIAVFPAFDEKAFAAASLSSDLTVLNQARAIERDFEVIQNYTAELTREGLIAAGKLRADARYSARRDFNLLHRGGGISKELRDNLIRIQRIRNDAQHQYPDIKGVHVYDAIALLLEEAPKFLRSYGRWLRSLGFSV